MAAIVLILNSLCISGFVMVVAFATSLCLFVFVVYIICKMCK